MSDLTFDDFFRTAAGQRSDEGPFPYQRRLAEGVAWPARIEIPTGLGKTLGIIVGWLWRRRAESSARKETPRRLVYCLPMRVLVEQTRDVVQNAVQRLGLPVKVVVLMGGVDDNGEWDTYPEDDVVIIGTQDMLLSRALNRGYGMSRYRWPLHFGLLNTDSQWIIDEVQLVGTGVATTAQLQALRRKLGTALPTRTSWMSATLEEKWLRTVDVEDIDIAGTLALDEVDRANGVVQQRITSQKATDRAKSTMGDSKSLAVEVRSAHRAGTRTLVIVNTVERARELFVQLRKGEPGPKLVLLHSRFRTAERTRALNAATEKPSEQGTIVVSTQVIEAGVDLSSTTMFTEIAPWASLVQRFGRCNRRGEDYGARVIWVGLPNDEKEAAKVQHPYDLVGLVASQEALSTLADAGPASLPKRDLELESGIVLRRRDLLDLFDTTADLMGNDVDVSRFIRDTDDHDVRVCWRDVESEPEPRDPSPAREELCAVPIGAAREWLKKRRPMWTWSGLRGRWIPVDRLHPGLTLLLRSKDGGYDSSLGLDPKGSAEVAPAIVERPQIEEDREDAGDPESEWKQWYTLKRHSDDVAGEASLLGSQLCLPARMANAVATAGRWHDAGKAHIVWQDAAKKLGSDPPAAQVAKSQALGRRITYSRRGFRHELASALLALKHGQDDLVCFLIACHHGKVRVSFRALPSENTPKDERGEPIRHARGVWEGDTIPAVDLGSGLVIPETALTLGYMELGDDQETGASWLSRVLALRDDPELGPFRLGFLEGLVKCADERASRRVEREGATP